METAASKRIGFLLTDDFPVVGLSLAMDVLRHANRFLGRARYESAIVSADGGPVRGSNGLVIAAGHGLADAPRLHMLFVLAGFDAERIADRRLFAWLKRLDRDGVALGGISNGAFVLARAGLLAGRRSVVHWEDAALFAELFPGVESSSRLFAIDRDRLSCGGGTATIDLFLRLVADDVGPAVAEQVSHQMLLDRIRGDHEDQERAAVSRPKARSRVLARAIELMEQNVAEPLPVARLARLSGVTRRQLHRLFARHAGKAPSRFYRDLRLLHARSLLQHTAMPIAEVAAAVGFSSHAHLTGAYRDRYGRAPSRDRVRAP
ncbi:MAG: GlxA family transcriptional regulator [Hyphomicrobiales bacterium]|nr:GlxA family transcriptional regulator [Hyphomicrobiales bacterium]MCP5373823.1 GlxA family transcriptional regulator [Hyphomicrobiales bacterium]